MLLPRRTLPKAIFYPLTTLVLVTACVATAARRPVAAEAAYPYGEAAAVYRTVLDTLYGLGERPPVIVLYDSTQLRISTCEKNLCRVVGPHKSTIESSTLRDFETVTIKHRIPIRADFGYRLPIVLVGDRNQAEFIALGEQIQNSVRDRVRPDEQPL